MATIPFSGTSRTITREESSIDNGLFGRIIGRNSFSGPTTLEEVIDINQDLELYNNHQLTLLNPSILYRVGRFSFNTQLLKINREEEVMVTNQVRHIPLVSMESTKKIIKSGKKLVHLGLVVIGIKGLARKKLGTKILLVIMDDRWSDMKKAMISAIEVDMNNNKGIFYCNPDFMVSIHDLKHIKIGIHSKGYEEFSGHSNILVNMGLLAKLTNNSTTKYKLNTERVIETMASVGIEMIKPMEIDAQKLSGLEWELGKMLQIENTSIPEEGTMYDNGNGNYSIRFGSYKSKNLNQDENDFDTGFRSE